MKSRWSGGPARAARVLGALVLVTGAGFGLAQVAGGCQQSPTVVPVRSLERSGKVAFVCLSPSPPYERPIEQCTAQQFTSICQYEYQDDAGAADAQITYNDAGIPEATFLPHLYALVTQTTRGEVAVIDTSSLVNAVLDENPLEPGANFLHVGAQPTGIAATPGSVATFVGVAEIGHAGLFAIPSAQIRPSGSFGVPDTCTGNSDGGQIQPPQLTTWPACSLPSAPGDIVLIEDPGIGTTQRPSCDAPYREVSPVTDPISSTEASAGRAKLVVALPDLGGIAVVDAQELFGRAPGSFDPCTVERWVPLKADTTGLADQPALPTGLACSNAPPATPPIKATYTPQLGGMSYADGRLYVADLAAPVIHVIDMHGPDGRPTPCHPVEQAPLLPTSAENPARVVYATKVAAAQFLTPDFKRYLYATDYDDASAMIFDIGQNSTTRRPLQRAHPEWNPFAPRDRIKFAAPPADIIVVQRDVPRIDPVTGLAPAGVQCNPDPSAPDCDPTSHSCDPGVAYRTAVDYTTGAGPNVLRGEFAFAALTSGKVAVIDIADFDAPCRAPVLGSKLAGCADDSSDTDTPLRTSAEISCRVVAPGEPRGANWEAVGVGAGNHVPGLLTFPQLFDNDGAVVQSKRDQPPAQMVATIPETFPEICPNPSTPHPSCDTTQCTDATCDSLPGCPLQTFVGGTLTPVLATGKFGVCDDVSNTVKEGDFDTTNALVMNREEPRAQLVDQGWTVTFEGVIPGFDQRLASLSKPAGGKATIADPSSRFCDFGVLGRAAVVEALSAQGKAPGDIPALADGYADYVQVTNQLADPTDPYWNGPAQACSPDATYGNCFATFGTTDAPTLDPHRDLRILEAYQDRVDVEARNGQSLDLLKCCFPTALTFNVRGGSQWIVVGDQVQFLNHVVADKDTGYCRNACDAALQRKNGRLIESARGTVPDRAARDIDPSPSFMNPMFRFGITQVARPCTVDTDCDSTLAQGQVCDPNLRNCCDTQTTHTCVHRGLPVSNSDRDDHFTFNTNQSFNQLLIPLSLDPSVLVEPQGITYLPSTQELAVTDGSFSGLIMVSLQSVAVSRSFF